MNATLRDAAIAAAATAMFHVTPGPQLNASCNTSSPWPPAGDDDTLQLPTFTTAAKVRVIITFILCGVSAFCNLAVLWAACSDGKRKSHVRVLILHLTAADLLVTFIVMPLDAVWNITVQWLAGDAACRLLMFLKLQAMYSCAFVTMVISLDRQSAILNPLAIGEARRRNRVMLSVAWTMSVTLSLPQLFLFHSVTIVRPRVFTQCSTRGSFASGWQETFYNMFTFCCLFLLPLVVMITCYSRIFWEISRRLKHHNLPLNEAHLRCSKNNIPRARVRTLKMSLVIVVSFVVCWTPYYLLGLWYWFLPSDLEGKVSHSLTHILFIFGLFNACLDPLIYGLFTIHFRKGIRRLYCHANMASELDNNATVMTGSFTGNAVAVTTVTALPMNRRTNPNSPEIAVLCGENQSEAESENSENEAEGETRRSRPESVI